MKHVILLFMLYAPLSCADDYEVEILKHVISPCLQTRFGTDAGIMPPDDPEALADIIDRFGDEFEAHNEMMEDMLDIFPEASLTFKERMALYQIGLDNCLGQQQDMHDDAMDNWILQGLEARQNRYLAEQILWQFVVYSILAILVLFDARSRKNNVIAWPVLTAIAGVIALPVYLAKRYLKEGETRHGGTGWNVAKYFAVFWTVSVAVDLIRSMVSIPGILEGLEPAAVISGSVILFLSYAVIWFVIIVFVLIVGLILKDKNVIEEGPTAPWQKWLR